MNKHAYLIIAHNQFYILDKLLRLIDDERNDIFVHIDKKVKTFDFDYFRGIIKKSNIYFVKRKDVRWADISQIEVTLLLLEESKKRGPYRYYHLLSGVDLPLKTQNEIHDFFDNSDKEYIHFCTVKNRLNNMYRYNMYWPFTQNLRDGIKSKVLKMINLFLKILQYIFRINRSKTDKIELKVGASWFSVSEKFVDHVLKNKKWILDRYSNTICGDESFIQTLVYNSVFKNKLSRQAKEDDDYLACLRCIDWKRGSPYIWTTNDFQELKNSKCLFARKFDIEKDKGIVDKIYDILISKNK